jgi:hypothetical protein
MSPEETKAYHQLLVRVSVALRSGLGRDETIEEVENEIDRLDNEDAVRFMNKVQR